MTRRRSSLLAAPVETFARREEGYLCLTLRGERAPSWNALYSGVHWQKRRALVEAAHALVHDAVQGFAPEERAFRVPVRITITAHYTGTPCDPDNVCAKLYIDGLRHAGVLVDDNPRYVLSVTTASLRAAARAGDCVTIEVVNA